MARKEINKEKLKIAQIGAKRVPSREGGIEVVVEEISTRMAALGHSVTVFNRRGHHVSGAEFDIAEMSEYEGVRLKYVWTIDRKGFAAVTSSVVASFKVAFGNYDVVHYHAEGPSFMCWLPKLFGKKIIVTVHGLDHQRAKWGRFASMYIMMGERNAVRFADEIIVLSKGVQEYFKETYNRKTRYVPNGVNRPEIKDDHEIKEKFGLEKDGYVLFLGRVVPEKGLKYLIAAYKGIKTDKKLVIAGGSSDTDAFVQELKSMSKGDERVFFTGFVQGEVLDELYSNAYIYVLPSDLEGMPLSLLEAMSYGNCCLVSDISECAEVVDDKAVVFKKSNVEDLREKLQSLLDDPGKVEQYKAEAEEYVLKKYNWDRVVNHTLKLYRGKA